MAQHQPGNAQGFTDPNRATAGSEAVSDGSVTTPADYDSNDSLDANLLLAGYTQATLDSMTHNDKVYAVRLADDSTTI